MTQVSREQALDIAHALVRESPADETEVTFEQVSERFVRFAACGPTQTADRSRCELAVRVRLVQGGGLREARASVVANSLPDGRRALARAIELAQFAPPNAALAKLGAAVDLRASPRQEQSQPHEFAHKATWIRAALEAARTANLEPAGLIQTSSLARAIVNSRGRAVFDTTGRHSFALTLTGGGGAGTAQDSAASAEQVDHARVISRAVEKAVSSRDPIGVPPGDYSVVLEPLAVSSILLFAAYQGFGAREVDEQSSFL